MSAVSLDLTPKGSVEIETIGADAILVHTALPEAPPQPEKPAFWRKLLAKLGT